MNNNAIIITIIVIVVALIGGWFVWSNYMGVNDASTGMPGNNNNAPSGNTGTLHVLVTDAAANMQNISAVNMTVDKISLHSQAQNWTEISITPQTFNLLALKAAAKSALAAKVNIKADTYDQIWFHVTKVTVTESGVVKEAKLPSGDLKMQGIMKVTGNQQSSVVVDVLADQSLHKTGKGEFIFAPVVKFETRTNATVNAEANNLFTVSGGTVNTDTTMGMDVNGEVKNNFKIDAGSTLEINGGVIQLKGSTQTQGNVNLGY